MAEIMQIQCYKCQTVYEVSPEMAGQLVECAVCNAIFAIPAPIPGMENQLLATYPYVELPDAAARTEEAELATHIDVTEIPPEVPVEVPDSPPLDTSFDMPPAIPEGTSTIKLSRSNIGMMPKIEDTFKFNTVEQKVPKNKYADDSSKDSLSTAVFKKPAAGKSAPVAPPPPPPKWWQFWKRFSRGN
jgi:hypothetical protein